MRDIVIPKGNEIELIRMAEKLGYSDLVFLYESDKNNINLDSFKTSISLKKGFLGVSTKNGYLNIIKAGENNRHFFENRKVDIIFGLESAGGRDFMHHRNSGLNHVLCKLARDKNISIGFSFFELFISNKKELILGRIIQNVRFLKKYRVECFISSFASEPYQMRSKEDFNSFSRFIGIQ